MVAPDFTLPDQDGKSHTLSAYKGRWIVLYFYPKNDTPICVKEACSFRDNYSVLKKRGVVILGVSADSIISHQEFIKKYHLNFTLLSDESTDTIKKYKAWGHKVVDGVDKIGVLRRTYLINPEGMIAKFYETVDPQGDKHANEILADLDGLQNSVSLE